MKKFILVLRIVIGIALMIIGVSQIVSVFDSKHVQNENQDAPKQVTTSELKSSYILLEIGMSYEDCVDIIGVEGDLFSETETEYFGKSEVYLWTPKGEFITGIEAHFDNGKLSSKTWVD